MSVVNVIKKRRKIKEFYDWQKEFFNKYPDLDKSVIVNAPTGAGKTIVAEAYILNCLNSGKKAVYIAPLRSLSFEKYSEWKKVYKWKIKVESGDFRKGDDDPDVYIFTFEKFLMKLVNDRDFMSKIGLIVVDEIHTLIEDDRGAVLEFALTLAKEKSDLVILGLSATIKNIHEVANWLGCDVFSSVNKVIDVDVKVIHDYKIYDRYLNEVGRGDWLDVVVSKIVEGKRVIVFVNKRGDTKKLAMKISEKLANIVDSSDTSNELCDIFGLPAHKRVAYHNGALDSNVRKMVEEGFRTGSIQCIVATKTLAMGVNLPVDVVIVKDLFYFDKGEMKPMRVIDVWQMIGRAGRHTKKGEAYLVAGRSKGMLGFVVNTYLFPNYEDVRSWLTWTKHFHMLVLYAIQYLGGEVMIEDLYELFDETFYRYFYVGGDSVLRSKINECVQELVCDGFLDERQIGGESIYTLSYYGKLVCKFCVDPKIVSKFLCNMDMLEGLDYKEFVAWMVIMEIFNYVPARVRELKSLIDILFEIRDVVPLSRNIGVLSNSELARILKTIDVLWQWMDGKDVKDLILVDLDTGLRYITLFKILAKHNKYDSFYEKLTKLYFMVKYGVTEDLVEYVKKKGVGRKKALRYLKA